MNDSKYREAWRLHEEKRRAAYKKAVARADFRRRLRRAVVGVVGSTIYWTVWAFYLIAATSGGMFLARHAGCNEVATTVVGMAAGFLWCRFTIDKDA